jgi:hypothetical protein
MLVVTIDLVPGGNAERRRTIGSFRIANISDPADVSDYRVEPVQAVRYDRSLRDLAEGYLQKREPTTTRRPGHGLS